MSVSSSNLWSKVSKEIKMANYTIPYSAEIACSQPNVTIPPPPFLPITNNSVSFCAISNYVPNVEILLSSCCSTNATISSQSSSIHNQTPTSGYEANNCSWRYCNVTEESSVKAFGSCLNRTATTDVEGQCFSANGKDATSEGISISWKLGKKKKTVSVGLLIALGVAGMLLG